MWITILSTEEAETKKNGNEEGQERNEVRMNRENHLERQGQRGPASFCCETRRSQAHHWCLPCLRHLWKDCQVKTLFEDAQKE